MGVRKSLSLQNSGDNHPKGRSQVLITVDRCMEDKSELRSCKRGTGGVTSLGRGSVRGTKENKIV